MTGPTTYLLPVDLRHGREARALVASGEAAPLAAWAIFCSNYPAECAVDTSEPETVAATPELDSLVLFGTGAAGLGGYGLMRLRAGRRHDDMETDAQRSGTI